MCVLARSVTLRLSWLVGLGIIYSCWRRLPSINHIDCLFSPTTPEVSMATLIISELKSYRYALASVHTRAPDKWFECTCSLHDRWIVSALQGSYLCPYSYRRRCSRTYSSQRIVNNYLAYQQMHILFAQSVIQSSTDMHFVKKLYEPMNTTQHKAIMPIHACLQATIRGYQMTLLITMLNWINQCAVSSCKRS